MSLFSKAWSGARAALLTAIAANLLFVSSAFAQNYLSLNGGSASPGASAVMNLTLNSNAGSAPAGVQWTFAYPAAEITSVSVAAGSSATSAGKTVSCSGSSGTYTCIVAGTAAVIPGGTVAVATFQLAPSVTSSAVSVQMNNTYAALPAGTSVGASGTTGVITVLSSSGLSTFTCTPSSLTAPGTVSCAVGLTSAAPAAGVRVNLSSSSGSLTVPSSVTVAAGASSASFTANATAVTANTNVTLTASYNGVTRTVTETLLAASGLSTFTCTPSSLTAPGTVSCAVGLTSPAPAAGVRVNLSSNSAKLAVPSSVTVAAGASSASFTANATAVTANTNVTLTASYNGVTRTVTETLLPQSAPAALSSVACSPATISANGSSSCTVTLTKAASAAFAVALSSNNSFVTVPVSVSVAAGASYAVFTAGAGAPASNQTATLTATASGVSRTTTLAVTGTGTGGGGGTSAITYIQSAKFTSNNGGTTVRTTLSKPSVAGNTLIAAVSWGDVDVSGKLSATDNAGNVYQVATRAWDSRMRQGLAILYVVNAKGGATTTTVSFGSNVGYHRLITLEYSNIAALDVTAKNIGTASTAANAVTSTAATTRYAGELIFGAVMDDYGVNNITPGSGFTQRASVNNKDLACQDRIQASPASVASTQTFSANHYYLAQMATFRPK
jgi:hypothetical protein